MNSRIGITMGIAAIVVLVTGGIIFANSKPRGPGQNIEESRHIVYSAEEVATHNNADSCWTVINGAVYDLTSWINRHPGGDRAILSLCGIDGTQTFEGMHAASDNALAMLNTMLIGLVNTQVPSDTGEETTGIIVGE